MLPDTYIDIEVDKTYGQLEMPVLGIGSNFSYNYIKMGLPSIAKDCKVVGILDSGHYMIEENPEKLLEAIIRFLR